MKPTFAIALIAERLFLLDRNLDRLFEFLDLLERHPSPVSGKKL